MFVYSETRNRELIDRRAGLCISFHKASVTLNSGHPDPAGERRKGCRPWYCTGRMNSASRLPEVAKVAEGSRLLQRVKRSLLFCEFLHTLE